MSIGTFASFSQHLKTLPFGLQLGNTSEQRKVTMGTFFFSRSFWNAEEFEWTNVHLAKQQQQLHTLLCSNICAQQQQTKLDVNMWFSTCRKNQNMIGKRAIYSKIAPFELFFNVFYRSRRFSKTLHDIQEVQSHPSHRHRLLPSKSMAEKDAMSWVLWTAKNIGWFKGMCGGEKLVHPQLVKHVAKAWHSYRFGVVFSWKISKILTSGWFRDRTHVVKLAISPQLTTEWLVNVSEIWSHRYFESVTK